MEDKMSIYFPIHVAFRNLPPSEAIEANVYKHAEKLGRYFDSILNCHVSIETHHHHNKGNIYHVCITLKVPNAELVANRDPAENHAHEDAYVAVRDAFKAIQRQLQDYAHKLHGDVKHHKHSLEGYVREIAPPADYGYIETTDGRRIRFSSKSVIDYDFRKLEIGDRVTFVEVESNDGPAASTVYVR